MDTSAEAFHGGPEKDESEHLQNEMSNQTLRVFRHSMRRISFVSKYGQGLTGKRRRSEEQGIQEPSILHNTFRIIAYQGKVCFRCIRQGSISDRQIAIGRITYIQVFIKTLVYRLHFCLLGPALHVTAFLDYFCLVELFSHLALILTAS